MSVKLHEQDVLAHVDGPDSLAGQTALSQFCHTFFGVLEVCAGITGDSIEISVSILGKTIGKCVINPQHPTCTIGGSAAGFKAEVEFSFDFQTMELTIKATLCAPLLGCKSGSISVKL